MSASARAAGSSAGDRALIAVEALVGLGVIVAVIGKGYGPAATVLFTLSSAAAAATAYFLAKMVGALRDETLDVQGAVIDEDRERLEHEKLLLLQGIKELEADAATGKVDPDDYVHLRQKAEAR